MQELNRRKRAITRVTLLGSLVNFALLVFKFAAGILGHSAAMIADAVHSLSDFATDLVVLVFIRISSKPQDDTHKYGHGKYETLATAIIGLVLFGVGAQLLWNGGDRIVGVLFRGERIGDPGMIALVAAIVSILSKECLYHYTLRVGRREKSKSVVANAWHHRSDAFSSIGTALGIGGAISLGDRWNVLDPLAAVVVSVFIMKVAVELLLPAVNELLEKSLPPGQERRILEIVSAVPGISGTHRLRTRGLGHGCAVDVHVRVEASMPVTQAHEITREIERRLREEFGEPIYICIHVEPL